MGKILWQETPGAKTWRLGRQFNGYDVPKSDMPMRRSIIAGTTVATTLAISQPRTISARSEAKIVLDGVKAAKKATRT